MMAMTTISSISVKPRWARCSFQVHSYCLPLRIRRSIAGFIHGFRENVENVLAAPGSRKWAHPACCAYPSRYRRSSGSFGMRRRNLHLPGLTVPADGVRQFHAVHQNLQSGRIAIVIGIAA